MRPLEKITTPLQLFKRMKGHGFLSRDNLIYLQKALMTIKRMDLVLKVVEYARQMGDTLHFYPAPDQPGHSFLYQFCITVSSLIIPLLFLTGSNFW